MGMPTSNWRWRGKSVPIGSSGQTLRDYCNWNWSGWGRCWVVAIFCVILKIEFKFSNSTSTSVWSCMVRVQDDTSKTTVYFHFTKNIFKLSPHSIFLKTQRVTEKLTMGVAWQYWIDSVRALLFFSLVCFFVENSVVLGFGLILWRTLFLHFF